MTPRRVCRSPVRASSPVADTFRTAAFRTEPFTISLGAGLLTHPFSFPLLTALEWLEIMGSDNWLVHVVRALDPDTYERLLDCVQNGQLGPVDVRAFAHSALAQSAGRPWWEAERLVNALFNDSGRLLGTLLGNGTDPSRMTLAVLLACVWATLTKGADAEAMLKLETALLIPPPEATEEERAGLDEDDEMFTAVDRLRSMPGVRTG